MRNSSALSLTVAWCSAALVAAAVAFPTQSSAGTFQMYEATFYTGAQDFAKNGIPHLQIIYGEDLGQGVPTPARAQQIARNAKPSAFTVIDYESWPITGTDPTSLQSVANFRTTLQRIHAAMPNAKLGLYSVLPLRDYWNAIRGPSFPGYVAWQKQNDVAAKILPDADALFASVYTLYDNQAGWVQYATGNLAEARRIAKGKPVFCFLWPQNETTLKFIDAGYWRTQLDTCHKLADGIVIWGGAGTTETFKAAAWDPKAPWWLATLDFLNTIKH